jgi:hypothetical protein
MGALDLISNLLSAVAGLFGWARDRQKLNNTPEMQAAEIMAREMAYEDRVKLLQMNAAAFARQHPGRPNPFTKQLQNLLAA